MKVAGVGRRTAEYAARCCHSWLNAQTQWQLKGPGFTSRLYDNKCNPMTSWRACRVDGLLIAFDCFRATASACTVPAVRRVSVFPVASDLAETDWCAARPLVVVLPICRPCTSLTEARGALINRPVGPTNTGQTGRSKTDMLPTEFTPSFDSKQQLWPAVTELSSAFARPAGVPMAEQAADAQIGSSQPALICKLVPAAVSACDVGRSQTLCCKRRCKFDSVGQICLQELSNALCVSGTDWWWLACHQACLVWHCVAVCHSDALIQYGSDALSHVAVLCQQLLFARHWY